MSRKADSYVRLGFTTQALYLGPDGVTCGEIGLGISERLTPVAYSAIESFSAWEGRRMGFVWLGVAAAVLGPLLVFAATPHVPDAARATTTAVPFVASLFVIGFGWRRAVTWFRIDTERNHVIGAVGGSRARRRALCNEIVRRARAARPEPGSTEPERIEPEYLEATPDLQSAAPPDVAAPDDELESHDLFSSLPEDDPA